MLPDGALLINVGRGSVLDEAALEKVEQFDERYRMKEAGGVLNWFEISAPAGYFSVNDTLGSIMATARGKLFLISFARVLLKGLKGGDKPKKEKGGMSVSGFALNRTMIDMAKGFTVKRVFSMLGGKFQKEEILALNRKLNKIKKPKAR